MAKNKWRPTALAGPATVEVEVGCGDIPCRFTGTRGMPAGVIETTFLWHGNPTGKRYEKGSDGLFRIDPRDLSNALLAGFSPVI